MAAKTLILFLFIGLAYKGQLHAYQDDDVPDELRERLDKLSNKPTDSLFLRENERYKNAVEDAQLQAQAEALQRMGRICYESGLFAQSLNFHLQAEQILRVRDQDQLLRASNLNDLGLLLLLNNRQEEARKAYDQALDIYSGQKDMAGIGATWGNLGHLEEKLENYDRAFHYQRKAMEIFLQTADLDGIAMINENLGSIYEDQEQFALALEHFLLALDRFEVNGNTDMQIDAYNNVGDAHRKMGRYREAMKYTRLAEKLAKETGARSRLSSAYRDLGKTYYLLGNLDSTFHYLELSRQLFLEIYSDDSKNQAALLNVLYDIQERDQMIADMARQRKYYYIVYAASGALVTMLILLAFIFIRNQRARLRNERDLKERENALLKAKQALMEAELENKELQEIQMQNSLDSRAKEITMHTLQALEKNRLLEEMKEAITSILKNEGRSYKRDLKQLLNKMNQSFNKDVRWDDFRKIFEEVHQQFFDELNKINPDLSASEIRLICLIKMNMEANDMATVLGISADSLRVARHRLRKKLQLDQGKSLTAFVQSVPG